MPGIVACSNCFHDQGLRLSALRMGAEETTHCPHCGSTDGRKLDIAQLEQLAHSFFVRGTLLRLDYGAAPLVQFNTIQKTSITGAPSLEADLRVLESILDVGFFHYGPRLWMLGEIEPLKALQEPASRSKVIDRIVAEYPEVAINHEQLLYRLRVDLKDPADPAEYDSPPPGVKAGGRLASPALPVMYCSPDLEVCIHECRATADDDVFVATLAPTRVLHLLDLTEVLQEPGVTEFESLDLAVHMLFLAGGHSYEITRAIALAAHAAGYDGLIYPSYFSLLRTGAIPFETTYGLSHRRVPGLALSEKAKIVPNLALFGRPVAQNKVTVLCLNKVFIRRADYDLIFGPVGVT